MAILAAILNRLLGRIGRIGRVGRVGRIGWVGPSLVKPSSEEAALRVPSAPNGPALRCECGYRKYNEHGCRAMPGTA